MIEKQFTALLRSFVQDTVPKTEEPWNMAELQRAAAQQNMLPVLAYEKQALEALKGFGSLPPTGRFFVWCDCRQPEPPRRL